MRTRRTTLDPYVAKRRARARRACGIALSSLVLSLATTGCASVESVRARAGDRVDTASLDAAMHRWNRCIERQSTTGVIGPIAALRAAARSDHQAGHGCEGHRRDIAMRFPPHLEERVTSRLLRREQALTQTASSPTDLASSVMGDWLGITPAD